MTAPAIHLRSERQCSDGWGTKPCGTSWVPHVHTRTSQSAEDGVSRSRPVIASPYQYSV